MSKQLKLIIGGKNAGHVTIYDGPLASLANGSPFVAGSIIEGVLRLEVVPESEARSWHRENSKNRAPLNGNGRMVKDSSAKDAERVRRGKDAPFSNGQDDEDQEDGFPV